MATCNPALPTLQTSPPIGCHFQKRNSSARLEKSTYVLRSIGVGTILVHIRLNHCLAIRLCCTANKPSRPALVPSATTNETSLPESIDFGTPKPPRNPIA